MGFHTLEQMILATAESVRPPRRMTVAECAAEYRMLNNPGAYNGPWKNETVPYMVEPMNELSSTDYTGLVFVGPAQSAKALPLDTPIPTPSGWTTMGDLKVGDRIFDESGRSCAVTLTTKVMLQHKCFRITFDDDTAIIADAGHKWAVTNTYGTKMVTTTEVMSKDFRIHRASGKWRSRYAINMQGALDLPDRDLPIDPYVLGVWLGDGANHTGHLTLNETDVDWICDRIRERGYLVTKYEKRQGKTPYTVRLNMPDGSCFLRALREAGLSARFERKLIPPEYLRASERQRRELLRGLMDTDGHAQKNGRNVDYATSDEPLLNGFRELLWSLGFKHHVTRRVPTFSYFGEKREGRPSWRVVFCAQQSDQVFSLPRQQERLAPSNKKRRPGHTNRRWVIDVTEVESVPVRCIQVDSPNHLFLAGPQMVPTHNTDALSLNWIGYTALCDPADMMIIQTSQATARDFAKRRIERLFRHSPAIGRTVMPGRQNQNTYDTKFLSGWLLTLSWPTVNELSGKPIGRLLLTDYDRMPEDIDGEGNPYDLARKRATTFRRYGMTAAESSPGFEIENPRWIARSPHEAPPTRGILALYNRGDRRRWYWRCPKCSKAFEPEFSYLKYPDSKDHLDAAEQTVMVTPCCDAVIAHNESKDGPGKYEMNLGGRWVKEGQTWIGDKIVGTPLRSDIASFWLKGVAAAFADWKTLVFNYLKAMEEYEQTGSAEALKTTVNTDQGLPFTPPSMQGDRLPEDLKSRAQEWGDRVVPEGVRFLIATVDIQKSRFVIQVQGVGANGDVWIVDRFDVRKSERLDDDGERYPVNPAAYLEDWKLLVPELIERTYALNDKSGRRMQIRAFGCDSGGREGVTVKAYEFWRYLRDEHPAGHHRRFLLLKGGSNKSAPRVQITYPDADRRDRRASARGEVPVCLMNTDILKDQISGMLSREEGTGGIVHFPNWLPDWFYSELTAEIRSPNKGWENPKNLRNEAWDLLAYAMAVCSSRLVRVEQIDWEKPPSWAADWDKNDLISKSEEPARFVAQVKPKISLSDLAESLA
jgi:phage terminase large subunit GpA-like protein